MAVNNPTPPTTTKAGNFFSRKLAGLPIWAWGLVGLAGVGLGYYFVKKQQGTAGAKAAASSPTAQTLATTDTTPSSEQVPNTTGAQVYIVAPPTPVSSSGSGSGSETPPPTPSSTVQIRAQQTRGTQAVFDQTHSGVFLFSGPGSGSSSTVPFGATVEVTGNAQPGASNGTDGATLYYPISYNGQSGWVSSLDLIGIGSGAGGGGIPRLQYRKNAMTETGGY